MSMNISCKPLCDPQGDTFPLAVAGCACCVGGGYVSSLACFAGKCISEICVLTSFFVSGGACLCGAAGCPCLRIQIRGAVEENVVEKPIATPSPVQMGEKKESPSGVSPWMGTDTPPGKVDEVAREKLQPGVVDPENLPDGSDQVGQQPLRVNLSFLDKKK